jgi:hypothetical protein
MAASPLNIANTESGFLMSDGTQIAMTYQADEDRILVRYPAAGREVCLWITRRMAIRWFGISAKIFDHVQGQGAAPEDQRRAVSQFQRESAVRDADFTRPYNPKSGSDEGDEGDETPATPSGLPTFPPEGPLLVGRLTITARTDGMLDLLLAAGGESKQSVTLRVSERELHGITHMLSLSAQKAQWGLQDPSLPQTGPAKRQRAH